MEFFIRNAHTVLWFCVLSATSSEDIKINFNGKVVFIADACSLIGASAAYRLAKLGATLFLTGRDPNLLESVANECSHISQSKPLTKVSFFFKKDDLKQAFNETILTYSKVDVLIYNPDFEASNLQLYHERYFYKSPAIDAFAAYNELITYALPYLEETKGTLLNIGLYASKVTGADFGKFDEALNYYTKYSFAQLKIKNAKAITLNPGMLFDVTYDKYLQKCEELDNGSHIVSIIRSNLTSLRAADTTIGFITKVVTYLASDKANVTNKEYLFINGNELIETDLIHNLL